MSNVRIVTKISTKKVVGKINRPTEKTYHMQVYGIATGIKTGESTYGPWEALTGQFRAVNLETGEILQSGVCFLPKVAIDLIVPRLKNNEVNGVEFAFNIGVIPADNSVGYEYVVDPLVETSENDPLEMLSKKVAQALPAPEKRKKKSEVA